jgi:hypothetical protein
MYCKMDVDDRYADPRHWRTMACGCAESPTAPTTAHGCRCPACAAQCLECPGFGYAQAPEKRFHEILTHVRSVIRRRVRRCGRPPGFVRLARPEIRVLVRKRRAEDPDHWINDYVELGPPVRVFDVLVVTDRRYR